MTPWEKSHILSMLDSALHNILQAKLLPPAADIRRQALLKAAQDWVLRAKSLVSSITPTEGDKWEGGTDGGSGEEAN